MAYKILILGASYGSLLASKMLFGGHSIHLVCLPGGSRSDQHGRISRAPADPRTRSASRAGFPQIAGQSHGGRRGGREPVRLRPYRPCDAGAAIPLPGRPRAARCGREIARTVHVDHEHAAAALSETHPRTRLRRSQARVHRCQCVGQFRAHEADFVQPRPAGDPSARTRR